MTTTSSANTSSSSSLPLPPRPNGSRSRIFRNKKSIFAFALASLWLYDHELQYSKWQRSARTYCTIALTTADWKFNSQDGTVNADLHQRTADRISSLIKANGGLYIKIGQLLATQSDAYLCYKEAFKDFTSSAPAESWASILQVFREEFGGRHPSQVFQKFEQTPIASASIAQVHRAEIDGKVVAVKIQRPAIRAQINQDIATFQNLMGAVEDATLVPTAWLADWIADQVWRETSFLNEAQSSLQTAYYVQNTPSLADDVHIPRILSHLTTNRVLTMEYIEGCRIDDADAIAAISSDGKTIKSAMDSLLKLFTAQIFSWGWIHCDPHPGNILVRPNPTNPARPQIVLIDHGLYSTVSKDFLRQYRHLWKALATEDSATIQRTADEWGIQGVDLNAFASLMFLKKTNLHPVDENSRSQQDIEEEGLSDYVKDLRRMKKQSMLVQDRFPKELLFIVRAQRALSFSNEILGRPCDITKSFVDASLHLPVFDPSSLSNTSSAGSSGGIVAKVKNTLGW